MKIISPSSSNQEARKTQKLSDLRFQDLGFRLKKRLTQMDKGEGGGAEIHPPPSGKDLTPPNFFVLFHNDSA